MYNDSHQIMGKYIWQLSNLTVHFFYNENNIMPPAKILAAAVFSSWRYCRHQSLLLILHKFTELLVHSWNERFFDHSLWRCLGIGILYLNPVLLLMSVKKLWTFNFMMKIHTSEDTTSLLLHVLSRWWVM